MRNLVIESKGEQIPVAELGIVSNKEQVILGNAERDLILRTAGNVKVQVGNKFYAFPLETQVENKQSVIKDVVVFESTTEFNSSVNPGNGILVYVVDSSTFYISINGSYVQLNKPKEITEDDIEKSVLYLAINDEQELNGLQKHQVLLNSGYLIADIEEVLNLDTSLVYANQIVLSIKDAKHYQLKDVDRPNDISSWEPLYISSKGGLVSGDLTIQDSFLRVTGEYKATSLSPDETQFKGFLIGEDLNSGGAIWHNESDLYISALANAGTIRFLTKSSTGTNYTSLMLGNGSVGIGHLDYNYNFNNSGTTNLSGNVSIGTKLSSKTFTSGNDGEGFALYKDDSNKWKLEIDTVIVREDPNLKVIEPTNKSIGANGDITLNSSITILSVNFIEEFGVYVNNTKVGLYDTGEIFPLADKGTYVNTIRRDKSQLDNPLATPFYQLTSLVYGIGDRDVSGTLVSYNLSPVPPGNHSYNGAEFVTDPGGSLVKLFMIGVHAIEVDATLKVGDLFYYREWDDNHLITITKYVEVVSILSGRPYVYVYGNGDLIKDDKLIKIGNRLEPSNVLQLTSFPQPNIELAKNITSFNDLYTNFYYTDKFNEISLPRKEHSNVRIGYLNSIVDEDLNLIVDNSQYGLYSDNAYLKGNFVGNKLILGEQLTYFDDVLVIKDLETFKLRSIKGIDGLEGEGNLFDGDVFIRHSPALEWTDKDALRDNVFISNLDIDAFGHLANWVTRKVTTDHIPEGSTNFYYRPDVQADTMSIVNLEEYDDNAAATAAGLALGTVYRTGDIMKIVH